MARHLDQKVRGRSEPVEAEPLGVPGHAQGPVTDEPRTEQRRGLEVRVVRGDREAEPRVRDAVFREPAIDLVAGVAGAVAEIFSSRQAVTAFSAAPAEPGNTDAVTRAKRARTRAEAFDHPHDLVAGHQGQLRFFELAIHDVKIGATDSAGLDPQEHLSGPGSRIGDLGQPERLAGLFEQHGLHGGASQSG